MVSLLHGSKKHTRLYKLHTHPCAPVMLRSFLGVPLDRDSAEGSLSESDLDLKLCLDKADISREQIQILHDVQQVET